jgi:hypothetical protein
MAAFDLDASVAETWCFPGDPAENASCIRANPANGHEVLPIHVDKERTSTHKSKRVAP